MPATPNEIFKDILSKSNAFARYNTIDENINLNIGNLQIIFCKNSHFVETYAVKVENGERKIVYLSDTSFSSKNRIVEFAKEADLIITCYIYLILLLLFVVHYKEM